jgi:hypothetical protein
LHRGSRRPTPRARVEQLSGLAVLAPYEPPARIARCRQPAPGSPRRGRGRGSLARVHLPLSGSLRDRAGAGAATDHQDTAVVEAHGR